MNRRQSELDSQSPRRRQPAICVLVCCLAISSVVLLVACRPAETGTTATMPIPVTPITAMSLPSNEPFYDLPPTQVLPTPQLTPTTWPTPQIPVAMNIDQKLDVAYKSDQKLDVFWPSSSNGWPIVVILHGGQVPKTSVRSLAKALAGQGAVVFVPEYQSYEPPPDRIFKGPEDAACAVRFARANGPGYGGIPERVVVIGHSAGGAYGALIALTGDQFHGDCLVSEGSAIPDLFIGLDGIYDFLRYIPEVYLRGAPAEEWLRVSPLVQVHSVPSSGYPPFHLFVGKETELLQNAQAFRDALLDAGYEASLIQFPGVDHMYIASGHNANTVWAILNLLRN